MEVIFSGWRETAKTVTVPSKQQANLTVLTPAPSGWRSKQLKL